MKHFLSPVTGDYFCCGIAIWDKLASVGKEREKCREFFVNNEKERLFSFGSGDIMAMCEFGSCSRAEL